MIKNIIILFLFSTFSYSSNFTVIPISDNEALNIFFSFPIYTMFVSLVFISLMNLFKKV